MPYGASPPAQVCIAPYGLPLAPYGASPPVQVHTFVSDPVACDTAQPRLPGPIDLYGPQQLPSLCMQWRPLLCCHSLAYVPRPL